MLRQVLRNWYQRWFVHSFSKFVGKHVTPIQITLLAGILGICIIPALAYQQVTLAIILLLISGYLDTVDGAIARINNQSTEFGAMLDILIDRSVEFAVILGLWLAYPNRSLMCILMLGSILLCVTSFLVVGIFTSNNSHKSFYYSPGIIERTEAFLFFILMILFPQRFIFLSCLFSLLVLVTTIIRVYEFAKVTQNDKIETNPDY